MQQVGVGGNGIHGFGQLQFTFNGRTLRSTELRLKQPSYILDDVIELHLLKLRLWHPGELAEALDDAFEIRDLGQQRAGAFLKNLFKLLRTLLTRPQQILDGQLQWE